MAASRIRSFLRGKGPSRPGRTGFGSGNGPPPSPAGYAVCAGPCAARCPRGSCTGRGPRRAGRGRRSPAHIQDHPLEGLALALVDRHGEGKPQGNWVNMPTASESRRPSFRKNRKNLPCVGPDLRQPPVVQADANQGSAFRSFPNPVTLQIVPFTQRPPASLFSIMTWAPLLSFSATAVGRYSLPKSPSRIPVEVHVLP